MLAQSLFTVNGLMLQISRMKYRQLYIRVIFGKCHLTIWSCIILMCYANVVIMYVHVSFLQVYMIMYYMYFMLDHVCIHAMILQTESMETTVQSTYLLNQYFAPFKQSSPDSAAMSELYNKQEEKRNNKIMKKEKILSRGLNPCLTGAPVW